MSQLFRPSTNTFSRLTIFGSIFLIGVVLWGLAVLNRSDWVTRAGVAREQPVPFSHALHTGGVGLDCRYCHTSVEDAAFAGMPATRTCMNCHAEIWAGSPYLASLVAGFQHDLPLRWTRVNDLPDFVYFDHSIHVRDGVGCATCHGPVDRMPWMYQYASLQMEWCLDCHRHPARFVRPRDQVFNMNWKPPEDQVSQGRELVKEYGIAVRTNCSTCHR